VPQDRTRYPMLIKQMAPPRLQRVTVPTRSVVGAMLEAPTADWYGLELAARAGIRSGTIYPILARLERLGWLESWWESVDPRDEGRPRRRLYRLTPEGLRAAVALASEPSPRAAVPQRARGRLRPSEGVT
jgi:DNA-binding MarR family transcriptional regulator